MKNTIYCQICAKQITHAGDKNAGDLGRQEVKYCSKECRKLRHNKTKLT